MRCPFAAILAIKLRGVPPRVRFWHVCSRFGHAPVTDLSRVARLVTHSDALDGATRGLALHYRDRDVPDRDTCAVTCCDCAAAQMISSIVSNRHVRGSRKRIPGSDPKDLDPGSVRIIDPTLTVCRQIHMDHRSVFAIRQEIHSDPRSKTSYCVWIQRDPRSEKRNSRIFYVLF